MRTKVTNESTLDAEWQCAAPPDSGKTALAREADGNQNEKLHVLTLWLLVTIPPFTASLCD